MVLTTLALFGTGVALAVSSEVPRLASADLRRGPKFAGIGGGAQRATALAIAIVAGVALGLLGLSIAASWL